MMNLKKSIFTVGGYTIISRLLGFVRDILIANFLGAGMQADVFFVAFRFPNLFRRLFAEGAFSAAFVPIFSDLWEKEGRRRAHDFADHAFTILALILICFLIIVEIFMPWAIYLIAPGFDKIPGKVELAIELSRITFPYLLFISLVSLQSGVLNSLGKFAAAAAVPVILNITIIVTLIGFTSKGVNPGYVLSWAISIAGIIQFLWLFYYCQKEGLPIWFKKPRLSSKIKLLGKRALPVVFGASLYQLNLLIGTILASFISDGAVSYLYYADRVTQLPLGVFGVSVGTALLPTLSRQLSAGDEDAAIKSQNKGLEYSLLLTIPSTIALIIIPEPIIMVLFERGAFDHQATLATCNAMIAFALGLPAYVLIRVLAPGFFAREDTLTPVRVAGVSMVLNIILNILLMQKLGYVGIAMASSVSAWANALGLAFILRRKGGLVLNKKLKARVLKNSLASLLMGAGLYLGSGFFDFSMMTSEIERVSSLGVLVGFSMVVFGILIYFFGAFSPDDFRRAKN